MDASTTSCVVTVDATQQVTTLTICAEHFDHLVVPDFSRAMHQIGQDTHLCIVDLAAVKSIDRSALDILMRLCEQIFSHADLRVINGSAQVVRALREARLNKLFEIEGRPTSPQAPAS